jgi:hypothetical protein
MSKTTPQQSYEAKRANKKFLIQLQKAWQKTVFHKWFSKETDNKINTDVIIKSWNGASFSQQTQPPQPVQPTPPTPEPTNQTAATPPQQPK